MDFKKTWGKTDLLLTHQARGLYCGSGESYFYSIDSSGSESMASGVSVTNGTVQLLVSGWADQDVKLAFAMNNEDEGLLTKAELDNVIVGVPIIPVPGAVLLGIIGFGCVVRLRRHI